MRGPTRHVKKQMAQWLIRKRPQKMRRRQRDQTRLEPGIRSKMPKEVVASVARQSLQ